MPCSTGNGRWLTFDSITLVSRPRSLTFSSRNGVGAAGLQLASSSLYWWHQQLVGLVGNSINAGPTEPNTTNRRLRAWARGTFARLSLVSRMFLKYDPAMEQRGFNSVRFTC